MNKNIVALKKNLIICPDCNENNKLMVSTVNAELMNLGYMLTEKAFNELMKSSIPFIKKWANDAIGYLNDFLGNKNYKTLHSNFPESVMNMNTLDLYIKAIFHYWSDGTLFYDDEEKIEGYSFENIEYKMIDYGTEEDFKNIFKKLAQVNTALTPSDFKILEWFATKYKSYNMPNEIPFKENLCMISALKIDVPIKTSTDVLRIASYLSHQHSDLILPKKKVKESTWNRNWIDNPERENYKFKLSNSERKYIMSLLNKVAFVPEMKERYKMWNKLAHCIHPTKYSKLYPKAVDSLRLMDSSVELFKKHKTFNSRLENETELKKKIDILKTKPGIFARKLNEFLLKYPNDTNFILDSFCEVGDKVSNKVLFELITYFNKRKESKARKITIKGARRPIELPTLEPLSETIVDYIISIIWKIFFNKFSKLPSLGNVWVDDELKKIPLPTNMRTLSDSTKVVIRGQRSPLIVGKKYVRFYLFWTAGVDLDLSCEFLNDVTNEKTTCSYHNLRPFTGVYHSGDIIPRVKGEWAEYIDIDIDNIYKNNGYRYCLMTVNNFIGGSLAEKGVKCGFMERDNIIQTPNWIPKTVTNSFSFNSTGNNIGLIIIDLKEKEWILVDYDLNGIPVSTGNQVMSFVEELATLPKYSVYDILKLHAESRGVLVEKSEEAETIFKFDDFKEDYTEIIKYML